MAQGAGRSNTGSDMNKLFGMAAAVALGGLAMAGSANAAISIGDTLQINYLYPTTGDLFTQHTTTFTAPGDSLPIDPGLIVGSATFTTNSVFLSQSYPASYTNAPFNGVEISDLTHPGAFAGWTVQPGATMVGFTESQSGGSIYVNWQGALVQGDILIAGVPEPATWALMLGGFGLAGVALRRRQTVALTA